ncbi:hypothetical protein [uncultured Acetobacteroides sp.]|nr:hypothetical protein [uncultured Acetobacteroides sp.]
MPYTAVELLYTAVVWFYTDEELLYTGVESLYTAEVWLYTDDKSPYAS